MNIWPWLIATVLSAELVSWLPLKKWLVDLRNVVGKLARVMRSRSISDTWKEKALKAYSATLLTTSALMCLAIVIAAAPFALVGILLGLDLNSLVQVLSQVSTAAAIAAVGIGYLIARGQLKRGRLFPHR